MGTRHSLWGSIFTSLAKRAKFLVTRKSFNIFTAKLSSHNVTVLLENLRSQADRAIKSRPSIHITDNSSTTIKLWIKCKPEILILIVATPITGIFPSEALYKNVGSPFLGGFVLIFNFWNKEFFIKDLWDPESIMAGN